MLSCNLGAHLFYQPCSFIYFRVTRSSTLGNPNNVSVRNLAQLWENVSKAEGGGGGIALDGAADRNHTGCAWHVTSNFSNF